MKDRGKGGVNSKSGFFLKFTKIPRKWLWCKDLRRVGRGRVDVTPYVVTTYNSFRITNAWG